MKIFSLLLLQCKKRECRMMSYLVQETCEVKVDVRTPEKRDIDIMNAQYDTICGMTADTNRFILLDILDSIRNTESTNEQISSLFSIREEDLHSILEERKIDSISEQKIFDLYNTLFSVELDNGSISCVKCAEPYHIKNNIVDFIKKDDLKSEI